MRSLLVASLLILAWAVGPSARAGVHQPALSPSVPADTLRYSVPAGETLIVTLPDLYRGEEASYQILSAPALSWLVDRSFFWQTRREDCGVMLVSLKRDAGSGIGKRDADRVVLRIELLGG